jgi:transposase
LVHIEQALLQGATAHGFEGELWTLERVAEVIWRLSGVRHHPAHVWALLRYRLGWTVQRPQRRAAERDQAAINHWVKTDWPRIKNASAAVPSPASSTSPA